MSTNTDAILAKYNVKRVEEPQPAAVNTDAILAKYGVKRVGTQMPAVKAKEPEAQIASPVSGKSTMGNFNTAMDQLKAQRRQASVTQDDAAAKQIYDQMKALRVSYGKQTLGDRLVDMTEAAFGNSAGSLVNAAGTGVGAVNELERIFKGNDKRVAQMKMEETRRALETGVLSDGRPVTDAMRPTLEAMLADYKAKHAAAEEPDPFEVRHPKLAAVEQNLYDAADKMDAAAAEAQKSAKAGLGKAGKFAVDAGIAGMQLYGDLAAGGLTGGGTVLPMGVRMFGGAAQEARQAGADTSQQLAYGLTSAAVSMLTEKIANVATPFKTAFGKGFLDDALAKLQTKPGGKMLLSALSEGGEEMLEAAAQPLLQKLTYDPAAAYDSEWLAETLYSGAIGAVLGGFGGSVDAIGSAPVNNDIAKVKDPEWAKTLETIASEKKNAFTQAKLITERFGTQLNVSPLANGAAGEYFNGTITIDPNAANPVRQVLVHELTHHMETSGLYGEFSQKVLDFIAQDMGVDVEALKQDIVKAYGKNNVELDDAGAARELVAKFAEDKLFQDEKTIRRLLQTDRNLFQKIYDWIRDTAAKLRGTGEEKFLIDAQNLYEKALRQAGEQESAMVAQNTFGGANARTADLNALSAAQQMESQGADANAIRQETGWFRGMDGKWRFEIDDSGMKYFRGGDAAFRQNHPEYQEYRDLGLRQLYDLGTERWTEADQQRMDTLKEIWGNEPGRLSKRINDGNARLKDIIQHDALFKAYPDLADVKVVFAELPSGERGFYNRLMNDIVLSEKIKQEPDATIIHEVQHVIQEMEDFAGGASMDYWAEKLLANEPIQSVGYEKAMQKLQEFTKNPENTEAIRLNWMLENAESDKDYDLLIREAEESGLYDRLSEYTNLLWDVETQRSRANNMVPSELYRNTAGEIEARDAAGRRTWTPDQRAATMPDLGNERTVFAGEAKWNRDTAYDPEVASIKEQMRKYQDALNEMGVVASATVPTNLKKKDEAAKWVTDYLEKTGRGYQVDKLGFGPIYFSKKDIDKGLRYADTPAEKAALAVLPQVLKKGIYVGNHVEHKGRPKETITFAAPVELNGIRGNMGVVVNKNGNHYYAHRILMPDGTEFVFSEEKNNAAQELSRGVTVSGSLADTTSAASNVSIRAQKQNVKDPYDIMPKLTRYDEGQNSMGPSFTELVQNQKGSASGLKMPPRTPQAVVHPTLTATETAAQTTEPQGVKMPQLTAVPDPMLNPTTEMVKNAYQNVKKARREKERAKYWNKLEPYEQRQVERLLEGDITLADLNPAKVNVPGIKAVYESTMEYENLMKSIREYKSQRKKMLRDEADKDVSTALNWIDKEAGILYSRETMERNIRDIVPDKAVANNIIRKYFKPVHDSQAMATRVKNDYRDRVRKLGLSQKVANGNQVSEAYAVQLLGEAEHHIRELEEDRKADAQRDGKTLEEWKAVVQDLWENNPKLNKEKIAAAVNEFRTIYDELFQQMNEVLIRNGYEPVAYRRGYFPHFQSNDSGMLAKIGNYLGITTDVTALPTSINGMTHTFKPGKSWFGHAQERKGFATDYDAVQGFDKYIEGAADIIHQTDNIQRLRALASQIRYRTTDEGIRKQIDEVRNNKNLTEDQKQNEIEKIYEKGRFTLSNFVVELEEYTNLLANKKSRHDRNMEQALSRRMYNVVKGLESRVAANMVAINPASWLTNFIPITQGAATLDNKALLKGMWETVKAYKEDDGMVDVSTFLTNRRGSDPLAKTWSQKASAVMASPMEFIDNFTADTLVRAKYYQNLDKGLSEAEALNEADSWAAGVMADRSKGAMPTLFNRANPLTKMFTQFQLEVNNQFSYLFKDVPDELKEKGLKALATGLLKMFVGAWLYNEVYEYFIGRRPALDPIDILLDTTGDLTGFEIPNTIEAGADMLNGETVRLKKDQTGVGEAGTNLVTNVMEELPFVSAMNLVGVNVDAGRIPVASAIPDLGNLWDVISEKDWAPEKRKQELTKEVIKPLLYVAAPFGGGQIKKVMQGLKAVKEGGSYTVNAAGEDILQYPVYTDTQKETAVNAARALVFGKSSLPTAQQWVASGFSSFGAKETAAYQGLVEVGVTQKDAYALIDELRKVEKTEKNSKATLEREVLRKSSVSGEGKSVVYYGLLANEKEQEVMDKTPEKDLPGVTNTLMILKDANALTGTKAYELKRTALLNAKISDSTKRMIYKEMISDSKEDEIETVLDAGLSFDTWLQFENDTNGLSSDGIRTKKEKVMDVIDKMNITDDQKTALYLAAGYKMTTLDEAPWKKKGKKSKTPVKLYMPKLN